METKKKRCENWGDEEEDILRQLVAQYAHIIENKNNTTSNNRLKQNVWKEIAKRLNEITGKNRSEVEIKLAWKRMKLTAKAHLSAHRISSGQTGGGKQPPPPSEEDQAIMAIVADDFTVDTNDLDCDGVHGSLQSVSSYEFQIHIEDTDEQSAPLQHTVGAISPAPGPSSAWPEKSPVR